MLSSLYYLDCITWTPPWAFALLTQPTTIPRPWRGRLPAWLREARQGRLPEWLREGRDRRQGWAGRSQSQRKEGSPGLQHQPRGESASRGIRRKAQERLKLRKHNDKTFIIKMNGVAFSILL